MERIILDVGFLDELHIGCILDYIHWIILDVFILSKCYLILKTGLHKLWYPSVRDTSTWSMFGAHGEHGDVFLFSNLGAL